MLIHWWLESIPVFCSDHTQTPHTGASASTLRAPQPSQEDRALTKRLVDAGQLLGITVLDHIILGDGSESYYSFADEGLLP